MPIYSFQATKSGNCSANVFCLHCSLRQRNQRIRISSRTDCNPIGVFPIKRNHSHVRSTLSGRPAAHASATQGYLYLVLNIKLFFSLAILLKDAVGENVGWGFSLKRPESNRVLPRFLAPGSSRSPAAPAGTTRPSAARI